MSAIKNPTCMDDYVALLSNQEDFISQANYGDGEWSCILQKSGMNSQGGLYTPELAHALRHTLLHPVFTYFGTNPGKRLEHEVGNWLFRTGINVPAINPHGLDPMMKRDSDLRWVHKEYMPSANLRGNLGSFISLLRNRKVILVGGPHLKRLDAFKFDYVDVPVKNAFTHREKTTKKVLSKIMTTFPDIVLFSAGMASNPIMWDLATKNCMCHMFDTGAIWDPFVGVYSRKGYQRPGFRKMILKSLEFADNESNIALP